MMKHALYWLGITATTLALALAMSISLDEPSEILDARNQAHAEFRRDLAAAKLCRETHGQSGFSWTADGELVCLPRSIINPTERTK